MRRLRDPDDASPAVTGPLAAGLAIGLIVALPLAAATDGRGLADARSAGRRGHLSVRCTATTLRAVDSGVLFARHIKVRCVACFERIPYPAYLCPNPKCQEIHWDIRPGRYGVLRRTCQCGRRMPTLLLLGYRTAAGSDLPVPRLQAAAGVPARRGAGNNPAHFRFQGRRQDAAVVRDHQDPAASPSDPGIHVDYADSATAARMRDLDSALAEGSPVPVTLRRAPKAYVLRLRIGRYHRIVQLLDAAGELFYDSQRSADLIYLGAANTFILVIDPLSINDFWDHLPSAERDRLAAHRSIAPQPAALPADRGPDRGDGTAACSAKAGHCFQPSRPAWRGIRAQGE